MTIQDKIKQEINKFFKPGELPDKEFDVTEDLIHNRIEWERFLVNDYKEVDVKWVSFMEQDINPKDIKDRELLNYYNQLRYFYRSCIKHK